MIKQAHTVRHSDIRSSSSSISSSSSNSSSSVSKSDFSDASDLCEALTVLDTFGVGGTVVGGLVGGPLAGGTVLGGRVITFGQIANSLSTCVPDIMQSFIRTSAVDIGRFSYDTISAHEDFLRLIIIDI